MSEKQASPIVIPHMWDQIRIETAMASARYRSAKAARRRRLSRADHEDLSQDILLAIVESAGRFDPDRASWSTFVALLARRVVIDDARRVRLPTVPLDPDGPFPAEGHLPDLALELEQAAADMPEEPFALLCLVRAQGDVADARRAAGQPHSSFYRDIADLRCWLRARGLAPASVADASKAA